MTVFRGLNAEVAGVSLSRAYEVSNVELDKLSEFEADEVRGGIAADDLEDARLTIDNYAARQDVD